ncbi:MAG: DUF5666 domain-containing protein [Dehalococcoidales bacterium]|nr:DUF5666 domain-containing protein [Dehalococcoidales bacterium]
MEGIITGVSNNQVTIIPERGGSAVTITINSGTSIILKDGRVGALTDLKAGIKVEAKYNPQTMVALKVYIDSQETAEVEGKITAVSASSLTLQTDAGRTLTLTIGNAQILREEDQPGIPSDLKVGVRIEVKFDPTTQAATRIKVKIADSSSSSGGYSSSSTEGPKVEGTIASLAGDTIVVNAEKGGQVVIEIANTTRIERDENMSALRSDLKVGVRIEAYYNSATRVASKITIKSQSSS